jgi:sensor histidine kinase YesM
MNEILLVPALRSPNAPTPRARVGLSRREAALLAAALWAVVYAGLTTRSFVTNMPGPMEMSLRELGEMALWRLPLAGFGLALCVGMHELYRRLPGPTILSRAPWMILAAAACGVLYSAANYTVFYFIASDWFRQNSMVRVVAATSIEVSWIFAAWTGFYLAITHATELRDRERRLAESEALANRAQFQMLRYQLNPHFLFNTLNSLSTLILETRNGEAESMVMKLAGFLRYTLDKEGLQPVRLADELEAQRLYLNIEQVRFGDRLSTDVRAEGDAAEALVPSLILQPIVENAVKHALARQAGALHLEIVARRDGEQLLIDVCDDGPGSHPRTGGAGGVGLDNVRRRLANLYGERATMTAGDRHGGGFAVSLRLPYERA